ncbi:MAG: glycosyltransferase family 4 protein [Planctomycetes bacterium]|nr:glycosyltransferase family 4 protein [Planctomycetota bacterium]
MSAPRPLTVVALTRTSSIGPSTRYRIEQYRALLAARGIEVETRPLFGPTWFSILEWRNPLARTLAKAGYSVARLGARVAQVLGARASDADLVLVEQQLFPYLPTFVEQMLWPRAKPTVLEFDDAIFLTFAHGRKLAALCARADLVIVGNRFLREFAARSARQVHVIPTTVDLARYDAALELQRARRATPDTGPLRVGWIGLRYNFGYLRELAAPLAGLSRAVELRVVSSGLPEVDPAWDGVRLVHRPWSAEGEAAELAQCDVGVMPLPDDPWTRGKCALKILQYMAAGVPVVASPVGVNADIVRHGENGLLAATPAGWSAAFEALAADPELRSRLGEAGRRTVEAEFSIEGGAEKVANAYRCATRPADPGRHTGSADRRASPPASP